MDGNLAMANSLENNQDPANIFETKYGYNKERSKILEKIFMDFHDMVGWNITTDQLHFIARGLLDVYENSGLHLQNVNARFSKEQSHKVRKLCRDFYLWMQANDYDHNIPLRVENKAELFLREKNVR